MQRIQKVAMILVAGAMLAGAGQALAQTPCGQETTLSPIPEYSLSFRVCGSTLQGTVTTLGSGWAAVGFGRDQFMPETDVFMAGVSGGVAYSQDAFALQRAAPRRDASQDVSLITATELDGVTRFAFSRPLNTGDTLGDFDLTQGPFYVLMAYQASSDSLTVRHSWSDASDHSFVFAPVPEPTSLLMMVSGLLMLGRRYRAHR